MQLGMLQSAQANHDAARIAYEKAVAIDAKFVPALNNLASVLSVNLGQPGKALGVATKARELAPSNPHVLDTLGWIHFLEGQFEVALPLLKVSAEKLPAEPVVQFHLAMCLYQLGQEAAARQAFGRVLGASTDDAILKPSRERLAMLELDPKTAGPDLKRDLEDRLQREPNDPVVLTRLAAIDVHTAAHEQAARRYEAALKINPRDTRTLTALVELYSGPVSNAVRARELARSAQVIAPHDGLLLWKLGRIALGLGDFSWAATALREASRLLPDEPDAHFDKAQAVYSVGRVEEAERALEDALGMASFARRREEATRFARLLAAAQRPERVQAARTEADAILSRDPDHVPALMVTALALEQAGDFKAANRSYERILGRLPLFAPALRQQALLYAEHLGDDKKAEELASKVRQAYPDDPELAYAVGTICFRRADYAEAVRLLRQSARRRERHAPTFFFLGMAQFHLKNAAESRSSLERALRLQLPPQEANEARRVLAQLGRGAGTP
jgi:tetratricopeptide (TPR) repeat protein